MVKDRRPRFTKVFSNGNKTLIIQPWEYEAEGLRRMGLHVCVRREGEDAINAFTTQDETMALKMYLTRMLKVIEFNECYGYEPKTGAQFTEDKEFCDDTRG